MALFRCRHTPAPQRVSSQRRDPTPTRRAPRWPSVKHRCSAAQPLRCSGKNPVCGYTVLLLIELLLPLAHHGGPYVCVLWLRKPCPPPPPWWHGFIFRQVQNFKPGRLSDCLYHQIQRQRRLYISAGSSIHCMECAGTTGTPRARLTLNQASAQAAAISGAVQAV